MKLLKPSWVTHGGKPIFSIDIHPDGSRFATGGQVRSLVLLAQTTVSVYVLRRLDVRSSPASYSTPKCCFCNVMIATCWPSHAPAPSLSDIGLQQSATLSHLQHQMVCARALNSNTEYHFWLLTYIQYLEQHGMEGAIRELCDDLLGPVCRSKSTHQWDTTILLIRHMGLLWRPPEGLQPPVAWENLGLGSFLSDNIY